jgi:hypothetical protein
MENPEHPGILHVGWRVGAENAHGLVGILTIGKWGSENTPEIIFGPIDKNLAKHIVALHNRTLKE